MNFKRKGPKSTRAGRLLCKPHKHQAEKHSARARGRLTKEEAIREEALRYAEALDELGKR